MKIINTGLSLTAITLLCISFSGCGSSSDGDDTPSSSVDITVERGPVYSATVQDSTGKIAQQKDDQNVYTFSSAPTYPITVTKGWVDVDGDKDMSEGDIELNMEMKSYSNTVTPITTYIAQEDTEEKREEKLQSLLTSLNSNTETEISSEDILKVASDAPVNVQQAINAVYAEMIENDSTEISMDDVLGRINDLENLDITNLDGAQIAQKYEEYILNNSDISDLISKLTQNGITKYEMPILNTSMISTDSKAIIIYNDIPVEVLSVINTQVSSYAGLVFYRAANNSTSCSDDFSGFNYCNEIDTGIYYDSSSTDNVSIIGVYDIPNYVEDTNDFTPANPDSSEKESFNITDKTIIVYTYTNTSMSLEDVKEESIYDYYNYSSTNKVSVFKNDDKCSDFSGATLFGEPTDWGDGSISSFYMINSSFYCMQTVFTGSGNNNYIVEFSTN